VILLLYAYVRVYVGCVELTLTTAGVRGHLRTGHAVSAVEQGPTIPKMCDIRVQAAERSLETTTSTIEQQFLSIHACRSKRSLIKQNYKQRLLKNAAAEPCPGHPLLVAHTAGHGDES
jgi:hypothetical protein